MTNTPFTDIRTVSDLKTTAHALGSHFFDADTMRFFNSRILDGLHTLTTESETAFGFFVTSERYDENTPRKYTVRSYQVTTKPRESDGRITSRISIDTVGPTSSGFGGYGTAKQARRAAREALANMQYLAVS